jgi:two-component system, response regulator FlrC
MALSRFGSTLAEVEREHILETLTCCDGNRTRTAKFLDISVRCLRTKLH